MSRETGDGTISQPAALPSGADGSGMSREGSREITEGIIISIIDDWCDSPDSPVPYTIWALQKDAGNLATTVRQTSNSSHVKASYVDQCQGDEGGTGGGILSGTHNAECEPLTWSSTVRAEDRNMVRHHDLWWMNHRNTVGRLYYLKDMNIYSSASVPSIKPDMVASSTSKPESSSDPSAASARVDSDFQALYEPGAQTGASPSSTQPTAMKGTQYAYVDLPNDPFEIIHIPTKPSFDHGSDQDRSQQIGKAIGGLVGILMMGAVGAAIVRTTRKYPNQTCENEVLDKLERDLQKIEDQKIKNDAFSGGNDKKLKKLQCMDLLKRIDDQKRLRDARQKIQDECFKDGTDEGHRKAIDDLTRSIARLQPYAQNACGPSYVP